MELLGLTLSENIRRSSNFLLKLLTRAIAPWQLYPLVKEFLEVKMYAIFRAGGKQYRVQAGDIVRVEKLDAKIGDELNLTDVLMVGGEKPFLGAPVVANAKVTVVVTQQGRGAKIIVFKKKRRQGYRRTQGHRQAFTELFVKAITSPDGKTATTEKKAIVIDPAKKALAAKENAETAVKKSVKTGAKKIAKKAAGKKVAKQATSKKVAAKKTTKKVAAKKKTTKKTSK